MGEVAFSPSFDRFEDGAGRELVQLGHRLVDLYLELVAARARPNTLLAQAYDLKVFFSIVEVDPVEVVAADVLRFISVQRQPRVAGNVVRIEDGESGLSARTIKRRLATVAGFYDYLVVRGDVASSPVPKGLASRRGGQWAVRGVPLIRAPRTLPRVIDPAEIDAFTGALRKHRDRAMVDAMLLGGLRRCEVLGLRFEDINAGERRVFIADGKGGHQRVVPISSRFFDALAAYLRDERPEDADTDRVFVVLKAPRRGRPLSAAGNRSASPATSSSPPSSSNQRSAANATTPPTKVRSVAPSPVRVEGKEEREWVLLDYGAFVVHVFHTDQRDFYQLERLWGDRPRLDWTPASPSRPETQVWQP